MLAAKTRKQRLRISLSVNTYGQEFYFLSSGPNGSFFRYWAGSGRLLKKEDWVAGGFYSGRNVEVFYQVFPGTLSTLGYFHSSFKELLPPGRGSAGVAQQCPVGK